MLEQFLDKQAVTIFMHYDTTSSISHFFILQAKCYHHSPQCYHLVVSYSFTVSNHSHLAPMTVFEQNFPVIQNFNIPPQIAVNKVALNGGLTLHAWWSTIPAASVHTSHRTQYSWISVINVAILVWCHRELWPHGSDSTIQSLTQGCYAQ